MAAGADDSFSVALNGAEKAAILLLSLGEEAAAGVMQSLNKKEIQQITRCASSLPTVGEGVVEEVQSKFLKEMSGGVSLSKRQSRVKIQSILGKFLNTDEVDKFLDELTYGEDLSEGFEALKYVDAETVAALVKEELPQTTALIVAHLDAQKGAQVLAHLSEESRADVLMRVANLGRISPQVIKDVQEVFVQKVAALGSSKSREVGGVQAVADLMNNIDSKAVQSIFEGIEKEDQALGEEIRSLMFVFPDLVNLDDKQLQSVIKEVTNETLTLSLKTVPEEMREKIYRNISTRAAEIIQEELEVMGPVKLSDVEKAQQEIVAVARRLEDEGKIVIGSMGGTEVLV